MIEQTIRRILARHFPALARASDEQAREFLRGMMRAAWNGTLTHEGSLCISELGLVLLKRSIN